METEGTSVATEPVAAAVSYDAFISYRRSDERAATAIYQLLELFGQRVFLDRRCIPLGHSWEATILMAARGARSLLVLWSRSAAASSEMKRELQMVSDRCRIVPIRLDMSPLPPDLGARQALEGLDVGSRIVARGQELVVQGGRSQEEAMATILRELRSEGIELTPEQRRRTRAYVGVLRRGWAAAGIGTALWLWSRASRAAVSRAGGTALLLGVTGVGLGRLAHDEERPETQCAALLAAAAPSERSLPPVSPAAPPSDPPAPLPALSSDAPAEDEERAALQRDLDESARRLDQSERQRHQGERQLEQCQRDARAALGECREEGRRALEALERANLAERELPASQRAPEEPCAALPADDRALRACEAKQAALLEQHERSQADLSEAQRQLRECRTPPPASSPPPSTSLTYELLPSEVRVRARVAPGSTPLR